MRETDGPPTTTPRVWVGDRSRPATILQHRSS
nr:MAG TPA: hypothetical protein [Caudoviricetes sp.]